MPEKVVYWRAFADFSKVREEAKRTKKSIEDLNNEVDDLNDSNSRLAASEDKVAKSNKKTGESFAETADKVAKAKKKQTEAAKAETKAHNDATEASAQARFEAIKSARASEQEAASKDRVTLAEKNLKNARLDQAAATRKVTASEKSLRETQSSNTSEAKDLEKAERELTKAREARIKAVKNVRKAEEDLGHANIASRKASADAAFEEAKSAAAAEKAAQKKAEAVEASNRRIAESNARQARTDARTQKIIDARDKATADRNARNDQKEADRLNEKLRTEAIAEAKADKKREDAAASSARRLEENERKYQQRVEAAETAFARRKEETDRKIAASAANTDKIINARRDATEQRDIQAAARESAREDARVRDVEENNRKLNAAAARLSAMQKAAASARQDAQAPSRDFADLQSRVSRVRDKIDKTPENKQSYTQARDAASLTRAENMLAAARNSEATAASRVNDAEIKLAQARAVQNVTSGNLTSAEDNLRSVRDDSGSTARDIADTENRVARARLDSAKADNEKQNAEHKLAAATRGVGDASVRTESAIHNLESATSRAARSFNAGGNGGNIFTRSMRTMRGYADKASDGVDKLGRKLRVVVVPGVIGAVYLLAEALSTVVGGLFALGSAIAPAVGGLAAAIPVAYALGGALLSVKAAFSGIGGVLKAYTAQQLKSGTAGTKAANTEANNADTIASAQQSLADAREQVGITAKSGAQSVVDASRAIVDANSNELDAMKALDQARRDARKNIEDLKNAVVDAALAERGAALDLADAKDNLQRVMNDPNATRNDRERAQLQVDQATQSQKETTVDAGRTRSDSMAANTAGVSGDSGVVAAKKQVADATYATQKAELDYRDALASASRDNAKAIRAVTEAQRSLTRAQRQSTAAAASGGAAADTYNAKLNALTPSARKFAEKLISMKKYWLQLKETAAGGLFPGLTRGLDNIPKLFPVIRSGVGSISRELGSLGEQFSNMITTPRWISAFKQLNAASTPIIRNLGSAFMHIIDTIRAVGVAAIPLAKKLTAGFDAWTRSIDKSADAAQKSGRLGKFFEKSYTVLHTLGQVLKNLGIGFYNMGKAASGAGTSMLTSMDSLVKKWADWTGSVKGQNELKTYFDAVRENMKYIDHLIYRLTVGFLRMGDNKNFKPILDGLGAIWTALKNAFGGEGNGVSETFVKLLHTIADAITALSGAGGGISVFLGTLDVMLGLFTDILKLPGVAPILGAIFAGFAAFKALKLLGIVSMIDALTGAVTRFKTASKDVAAAAATTNGAIASTNAVAGAGGGAAAGAGGAAAAGGGAAATRAIGAGARPIIVDAAGVAATGAAAGGLGRPRAALPPGAADRAPNRPGNPSGGKKFAGTKAAGTGSLGAGARAAETTASSAGAGALGAGEKAAGGSLLGGLAASRAGGAVKGVVGTVKNAAGALKTFFSGASKYGKGGPWAIAIAAIVTALVILYTKVKGFRDFVNKAFNAIWTAIKPVVMFMVNGFKELGGAFKNLWESLQPVIKLLKPLTPLLKILGYVIGALLVAPILVLVGILTAAAAVLGVFARVLAWAINNIVVPVIKAMISVFKALGPIVSAIAGGITTAWNAVIGAFKTAGNIISSVMGAIWKVISNVWGVITSIFTTAAGIIKDIVVVAFKVIAAFILAPILAVAYLLKGIWSLIGDTVKSVWGAIWTFLKTVWGGIVSVATVIWSQVKDYIIGPMQAVWSVLKVIWNAVKDFLTSGWNTLKDTAKAVWSVMKAFIISPISEAFGKIKELWNNVWTFLTQAWNAASGTAGKFFSKIASAIVTAFSAVTGALSKVWDGVKTAFTVAINFVTQDILNPLIGAINFVITKFGIDPIGKIKAIGDSGGGAKTGGPSASTGAGNGAVRGFATGGVNDVGSMLPGYTPGRDPHEFVSNTGLRIKLSGGEGILTPETTRALGGKAGIDRINGMYTSRLRNRAGYGGIGSGAISGAYADGGALSGTEDQKAGANKYKLWRFLKSGGPDNALGDSAFDAIGDAISGIGGLIRKGAAYVLKAGFQVAEAPIRLLVDKIPGGNKTFIPKMVNGLFDKVNKGVFDTIAGKNPKNKRKLSDVDNTGRYTGQINDTAAQNDIMVSGLTLNNMTPDNDILKKNYTAMQMSKSAAIISGLRTIISNESAWNASSVNTTDANASAGHPSTGLMQTIAGTYAAHKNPNFDFGMKDAVSNVTAGIDYANSRYGGVNKVPGVLAVNSGKKYVGYGSGGEVQFFHKGGLVAGKQHSNGSPIGMLPKQVTNQNAALQAQAGINFPSGPIAWSGSLLTQYRKRLAGVDAGHDSKNNAQPGLQNVVPFGSSITNNLMNWVDKYDPKSYNQLWSTSPYANAAWANKTHRNPLLPIESFLGSPTGWANYRKNKDNAFWSGLTAKDNKTTGSAAAKPAVTATHKGFENLSSVKKFIQSTDSKSYVYGAVGPDSYDCSGLVGEVWARLTDHPSYRRYFSTGNEGKYFDSGKGDGVFTVGYSHNGKEEHTAGRLDGLKFEARSSADGIIVGDRARNPESFAHLVHLPAKNIKGVTGASATATKKQLTIADEKKKHPAAAREIAKQDSQWAKSVQMISKAAGTEKSRVLALRKSLGLGGSGNNAGLVSSDMINPMDHAAAHAIGQAHPADWAHPWTGPVSAVEGELGQSDRSNALNVEWFDDLNKIAVWGYTDLVNYLLGKGITDGLSVARSAVKDQKTAKQLNDSIHAGLATQGVNGDDQEQILKIVAKLGSGTAAKPYGLRDVSAELNVSDYIPVNLFDKMSAQLSKLPTALTKRFVNDVGSFRMGTFYAATGGMVPGDRGTPNIDSVPAMLVPGEGVLSRKAMSIIGERGLNQLNSGMKPQMRADGGMIISPTFDQMGLGNTATKFSNTRYTMADRNGGGGDIVLNTTINNPTGESSIYSQNKALQRQAALGTVAKAAGK